MNSIWIVPIEPIDQRYTKQWYETIPRLVREAAGERFDLRHIAGDVEWMQSREYCTTPGAFLDFATTMGYKADQVNHISFRFNSGEVKAGDRFLITDAWNLSPVAIRYMSDLLDIPVEIHSIWHAGAYDPTDILGLKMRKGWPHHFERACYEASDFNYFGTLFHAKMFENNLGVYGKTVRSGQPHDAIIKAFETRIPIERRKNRIVWPHRYNADKQPAIAEDLKIELAKHEVELVITAPMNLTKNEYYDLLLDSKAVFSCSLHENLGISMMEGVLAGCRPIVPNRASYREMYLDEFKYPPSLTSSYLDYVQSKDGLIDQILWVMRHDNDFYPKKLEEQKKILLKDYLRADVMINNLVRYEGV